MSSDSLSTLENFGLFCFLLLVSLLLNVSTPTVVSCLIWLPFASKTASRLLPAIFPDVSKAFFQFLDQNLCSPSDEKAFIDLKSLHLPSSNYSVKLFLVLSMELHSTGSGSSEQKPLENTILKTNFLRNCCSLSIAYNYANYFVLGIFKAFIILQNIICNM